MSKKRPANGISAVLGVRVRLYWGQKNLLECAWRLVAWMESKGSEEEGSFCVFGGAPVFTFTLDIIFWLPRFFSLLTWTRRGLYRELQAFGL